MSVVHSIKRAAIGGSAAKHEPTDPTYEEYEILKYKLTDIKDALEARIADIRTSQLKWNEMVKETDSFYSKLHKNYPYKDKVHFKLERATLAMQGNVIDRKIRLTGPDSICEKIIESVRLYISHIKGMEETYRKLEIAYKDKAMYHQKTEKLFHKDADDEKQTRNVEKFESSKINYEALVESTVTRQKAAEDLAPDMFNSLLICHARMASGYGTILREELVDMYTYANSGTNELVNGTRNLHVTPVSKTEHIASTVL